MKCSLALIACLALPAWADDLRTIEGVTDSRHPFTGAERVRQVTEGRATIETHVLDAARRLETDLGHNLPPDRGRAEAIVRERLNALGEQALQDRAQRAYSGLMMALKYRIDRYPAVVINGEAVVYGETDLVQAWRRYHEWSRRQ